MLWLIVNPSAGNGRTGARLGQITARLDRLGLTHSVHPTESLEHARELASRASSTGASPVTFGGDGLIGAVAGALAGSGTAIGILPGGRGNDIARTLGIPADPLDACAVLADGREVDVDLGRVTAAGSAEAGFLGIVSCGLDSEANRIANTNRWIRGKAAYSYGGLCALAGWTPTRFQLAVDGRERDVRGYTVAVANSPAYGGGMRMAPQAETDDGLLDVVVIEHMPKLRFLANMPRIFTGSHVRMSEVTVLRGREVEIRADRRLSVYGDGERVGELPARLSLQAAAVRVRVPRP